MKKKEKIKSTGNSKKICLTTAFKNNFFMLHLAFLASPSRVISEMFRRGFYLFEIYFYGIIFWETVLGFIEKKTEFSSTIPFIVLAVCVSIVAEFGGGICSDVIGSVGNQRMYEFLHLRMFNKSADVELSCFEDPSFYNKYMKAIKQVKSRAHTVLWTNSALFLGIIYLIALLYKTITIDPFAILFALFPMFSTYVIGKAINNLNYKLYQENIFEERKSEYVKRTIFQKDMAKELRLSNGFTLLMYYYRDALRVIMKNTKKYGLKAGLLTCLSESVNQVFVAAGSILYASVRLVYFKDINAGEYIILVNAISQISNTLIRNADSLSRIVDNSLYIQNIRDFFNYKPKIAQSQQGKDVDKNELLLKMDHVSFTYFGQSEPVLSDICLSIAKKEKIVLVGENGAGKSTLVKLLMRLYDPDSGDFTLNGTNVKDYNVAQYRDLFGTVFQDYRIFGLTVAENVLMHRMKDEERPIVENALKSSGIYDKVMTLPNGIDTMLTREFDPEGAVLSGGEEQKIAIARVFAKDCEIAILDEPSSALDPIAEYQMYNSMLKACENKAVIFISHRLSSAVLADRIYMLENGRIVEAGSHEELMKKNGKYAEMFHFQANNYVGEAM